VMPFPRPTQPAPLSRFSRVLVAELPQKQSCK
jgi:hypothetical protein